MPMGGNQLGKAYATLRLEADKFNRDLAKSQRDFKSASTDIRNRAKSLGRSLKRMGVVAAAGMAAVSTAAWKMADSFGDAQKEARQVFTLMDSSKQQFVDIRNEISMLGEEYGIMQTEAMNAWYQITSATYQGVEATKMFEQSAKAAIAGATDQKTAADALTSVMNAYGKNIEEVNEVSDTFFQTVKRGKTTFGELGKEISAVTSLAPTLGVEFEDVGAALATLTRSGQNTAEATTNLGRLLTEMGVKPSQELLAVLHKLGYEGEQAGKLILQEKGLYGALQIIGEELKSQDKSWEQMIKRQQALRAALILTGKGAKGFAKDMDLMGQKTGVTEEAFTKMEETFWYTKQQMVASIDELVKSFGKKFAPAITDLIKTEIMPALNDFDKWVDELGGTKKILTDFFNKATKAAKGFFSVMTNISEIVVNITNWTFNITDAEAKADEALAAAFGLGSVIAGAALGFSQFGWPGLIAGALIMGWAAGDSMELDPFDILVPLNLNIDVKAQWDRSDKLLKEGKFFAWLAGMSDEEIKKAELWKKRQNLQPNTGEEFGVDRGAIPTFAGRPGPYDRSRGIISAEKQEWNKYMERAATENIGSLSDMGLAPVKTFLEKEHDRRWDEFFKRLGIDTPEGTYGIDRGVVPTSLSGLKTSGGEYGLGRGVVPTKDMVPEVQAIWEGFDEWKRQFEKSKDIIARKAQIFGNEFDATREKMSLYKRGINKLLEEGYKPQDKQLKRLIDKYRQLQNSLKEPKTWLELFADQLKVSTRELKQGFSAVLNGLMQVASATGAMSAGQSARLGGMASAAQSALSGNWVQAAMDLFTGFMTGWVEDLKAKEEELQKKLDATFSMANQGLQSFTGELKQATQQLAGPFGSAIGGALEGFTGFFQMTQQFVQGNMIEMMQTGFSALMNIITGLTSSFIGLLQNSRQWKALQSELDPIWKALADALGTLLTPVVALARWFRKQLGVTKEVTQQFNDLNIPTGFKRERKVWEAAAAGQPVQSDGGMEIPEWAKQIIEPIKQQIIPFLGNSTNFLQMIKQWSQGIWGWLQNLVIDWIPGIASGIGALMQWVNEIDWRTVLAYIGAMGKWFITKFPKAWSAFLKTFDEFWKGTFGEGGFLDEIKRIRKTLEAIAKSMGVAVGGLAGAGIGAAIGGAVGGPVGALIGGGIGAGVGALAGWLGFAEGGIVTQPTPGIVGEAGPEAVIPLDKMGSMGGEFNVVIQTSDEGLADALIESVQVKSKRQTGSRSTSAALNRRAYA